MAIARRIEGRSDLGSASRRRGSQRHLRERALAELATRQHGVVAAWQLLDGGFTHDKVRLRLDQGHLHELHLGIYAVGHRAITQEGHWLAAVLAAGPTAVLSHRDALALWDVGDYRFREIEVTLPGLGSRRRPGIRFHRTRHIEPVDRVVERAIPVTSLARTFADVAGSVSPRHLRDAYLEAERRDLVDIADLQRVVVAYRGKRGIGRLRRLVAEDTSTLVRTKSPLEVRFFDFCREEGIPPPLPNEWVHGFEVDAYWPDARLAIELDSWEYHRGRGAFERDRAKIGDLRLFDIDVLPVTHRRLTDEREKLARIIRSALRAQK